MDNLFSLRGRDNRAKYWLLVIGSWLLMLVILLIGAFSADYLGYLVSGFLLLLIPLIWIGIALGFRRLHDRDKSGWWLLLFYVVPGVLQALGDHLEGPISWVFYLAAFGIGIWGLIELGFLRGTEGPNQYGPDPLQARSVPHAA